MSWNLTRGDARLFGRVTLPMNESEALVKVYDTTAELVTLQLIDTEKTGLGVSSMTVSLFLLSVSM